MQIQWMPQIIHICSCSKVPSFWTMSLAFQLTRWGSRCCDYKTCEKCLPQDRGKRRINHRSKFNATRRRTHTQRNTRNFRDENSSSLSQKKNRPSTVSCSKTKNKGYEWAHRTLSHVPQRRGEQTCATHVQPADVWAWRCKQRYPDVNVSNAKRQT